MTHFWNTTTLVVLIRFFLWGTLIFFSNVRRKSKVYREMKNETNNVSHCIPKMRPILKRFAQVILSCTNRLFLKSKQSSSRKLVHLFLKPNGIYFFFREPLSPKSISIGYILHFVLARSLNFLQWVWILEVLGATYFHFRLLRKKNCISCPSNFY